MGPTEVCLSVDVEFDIAGAFKDPARYQPCGPEFVWGSVGNRREGLGFIMDALEAHGLRGVMFTEPFGRSYFGDEPMRAACEEMLARGHDVQLHTHPCWFTFENPAWAAELKTKPPWDSFVGLPPEETAQHLQKGIDIMTSWGVPRPIALRTGNLQADVNTYRAMKMVGLNVASNIGWAIYQPPDAELKLFGGRHLIADVLEVPVLTFQSRLGIKQLTITGNSFPAMRAILQRARAAGVKSVMLLTHPSEFFKHDLTDRRRRNRVNQRRFERLCAFLAAHPEDYKVVTCVEAAERWLEEGPLDEPTLQVPTWAVVAGIAHNAVNDRIWSY